MNLITFAWCLAYLTVVQGSLLNEINLIRSYFEEKSVKYANIFGCSNKSERIKLVKTLILNTQPVSVFDLNQKNVYGNLKNQYQHIGVVLDGDCPRSEQFLIKCGQLNFFDAKHHWLIITNSTNVTEKFKNVTVNINADINVVLKSSHSQWAIMDLYNPASRHGGILNYTQIGYYSQKEGYVARQNEAKYWARKNMTGVTFKSLVVLPVPFEGSLNDYLSSDDNRTVNTFNRFHSRLVSFCRDYYNFSMDIQVTKSWGYTNPDGTFDGMVGALERKQIDFGSSPLFVRDDRAKVIDYGRNTWVLRAGFIFRNPKSKTSIEVFLQPLSTSIWIITGLLAALSIIILKMVTTFERRRHHYSIETSWSLSIIYTIGAFCQQGQPSTPTMACGRITTISIFLLSVLIYQFYSASLVSHLLMKSVITIKTIKDLLASPLKAGCEDILYNRDYFTRTTDEVAKQLYHTKILGKHNSSNFLPPEQGLRLVENGGYAFHVEMATAYPIIDATFREKAICELKEVQLFRTQPMHANYQKESPFRDMLDTCLQRTAEHGLLFRERKHWHPRKPECIQSSKTVSIKVGLDEFYPALLILLIGIAISLTVLVVEMQIKIFKERLAHPPLFAVDKQPLYPFVQ